MKTLISLATTALMLCALPAAAQQDAANLGARLVQDAAVKTALEAARAAEPQTLDDQVKICEVEAPPFKARPGLRADGSRRRPAERAHR
jgi:hypothetical protein